MREQRPPVIHVGKRSLWDGHVDTYCGLRIERPEKIWFPGLSGLVLCDNCGEIKKARGEE